MFEIYITTGLETTYIQDRKYRIATGKIHKEVNAIDSFDFTITYENPGWSKIVPFKTWVKVVRTDNKEIIFDGRSLQPEGDMDSSGSITQAYICEGRLATLHDTRPYKYESISGTPKSIISNILNRHNTLSNHSNDIKLGQCPDTGSRTLLLSPEKDYYEILHDFVVNVLQYDHVLTGSTLDIIKDAGSESRTTITLGKNLTSINIINDPTGIISRIVPLGKTLEGAKNGERLTTGYIDDATLISRYGVQMGIQTYDNVNNATDLKTQGTNYLKNQKQENVSYKLTALDLSLIGKEPEDFKMGYKYRVIDPIHNVNELLKVNSVEIDPLDPTSPALTFGIKYKKGTDYTNDAYSDKNRLEELSKQTQEALDKVGSVSGTVDSTVKDVNDIKGSQSDQDTKIKELEDIIKELKDKIDGGSTGDSYYEGVIIDVSEFQGSINWSQVVSGGLALSIIRVQSGSSHIDGTYTANIPNAISAGANYAVYAYFSALNASDAEVEATDFYNRAQSVIGSRKQPRFWMIDVEANSVTSGRLSAAVTAYMNRLNALGIPDSKIVIYVSNALYPSIDVSRTQIWIPSYGANDGTIGNSKKPLYPYDLWQYTSVGRVSGISGNVDMNTDPSDRFKKAYLTKG